MSGVRPKEGGMIPKEGRMKQTRDGMRPARVEWQHAVSTHAGVHGGGAKSGLGRKAPRGTLY